ncbi:MAG: Gfo/Idh/MocA family oxidoreductase [Armatimonadota bacterium]
MDKVRLGVIGCGGMCKAHLPSVGGKSTYISAQYQPFAEQVEVGALCDVNLERAEEYRQQFGGEYVTDDVDRILSDPNIDAVLITTWHDTHAPFSVKAMQAGKHVLIEKPMAMTEQECDDVLAWEERSGVNYMVAFRCRFAKGSNDIKREIPQPDTIIANARYTSIWPEGIWPQDPIKGGGQILSQGCHVVDEMFYLAGAEPAEVWATGGVYHHDQPEPFDTINAAIRFKNGATGCFMGGDGGTGGILSNHPLPCGCPFYVTVVGKGRSATAIDHGHDARFESCDPTWTPPYTNKEYGKELGESGASGVPDILPAFAMSILKGEKPIATAYDGARTTRFILRCFESARTGKIMTF